MPSSHLTALTARRPELAAAVPTIEKAYELLRKSFRAGGRVLLCGNGGSAADADHWAGELLKAFCRDRRLSKKDRAGLPAAIAAKLEGALPAIPLTAFSAAASAFGNDVDPNLAYAQLTFALGRRGDVLVALSTSGNAKNVCAAAQVARARGLKVIALTGASGGKLKGLSDVCVRAPTSETYRAQEYYLPIYHCLSLMLEDEFFG